MTPFRYDSYRVPVAGGLQEHDRASQNRHFWSQGTAGERVSSGKALEKARLLVVQLIPPGCSSLVFQITPTGAKMPDGKRPPVLHGNVCILLKHGVVQVGFRQDPGCDADGAGEDGERCFHGSGEESFSC